MSVKCGLSKVNQPVKYVWKASRWTVLRCNLCAESAHSLEQKVINHHANNCGSILHTFKLFMSTRVGIK